MDTFEDEELEYDDNNVDDTFLVFSVSKSTYAIPIIHVTEIVRLPDYFPIPGVEEYVKGVVNLRGRVIPLLDVSARFGLGSTPQDERTVVIVLDVAATASGLIVDSVAEVAHLEPATIEGCAQPQAGNRESLVASAVRRDDRIIFVLDVATLIRPAGIGAPADAAPVA